MRVGTTDDRGASASRRKVLKGAAVATGAIWVAPTIDSFASPAAAQSGTEDVIATSVLWKDADGTTGTRCLGCQTPLGTLPGTNKADPGCSNAGRGSVQFTRTPGTPGTICVMVTLTTGTAIIGREVWISMSDGSSCNQVLIGTWPGGSGPISFACVDIEPAATKFSIHMPISGGGGNDVYTSDLVDLP